MHNCILYGLVASDEYLIRYIGQTVQTPERRLSGHMHAARKHKRCAVHKWVSSALARGAHIAIVVLQKNAEWNESEKIMIAFHRELGASLLNLTDGGEGTLGYRHSGRKRPDLSERNRQRTGCPGRPRMPGETEKLMTFVRGAKRPWVSERNKSMSGKPGHKHTEEHKAYMSRILTGQPLSEERKQKISAALKGKKWSPETRVKVIAARAAARSARSAVDAIHA